MRSGQGSIDCGLHVLRACSALIVMGQLDPVARRVSAGANSFLVLLLGVTGPLLLFYSGGDVRSQRRIVWGNSFSLLASLTPVTTKKTWGLEVVLGEVGARRNVVAVERHRALKFRLHLARQAKSGKRIRNLSLPSRGTPQPLMVEAVPGLQANGFFSHAHGGIPVFALSLKPAHPAVGSSISGAGLDLRVEGADGIVSSPRLEQHFRVRVGPGKRKETGDKNQL